MTFDDDFVRIRVQTGYKDLNCREHGIAWPPPEQFIFEDFVFKRVGMSKLTDEQRKGMTHVCRGAEYVVDPDQSGAPGPTVLC